MQSSVLRLLPLILRNVLRNRRRSLLTLASAAVSLAVLGFLVSLYQGFFFREADSPSEALRLITRHKVSLTNTLPASYEARIASLPGVEAISAWSWFGGKYKDDRPENFFARFGVDPDGIQHVRTDYVAPPQQWAAFVHDRTGCAIGRAIADKHGFKLGDRIHINGDIYPVNLELTVDTIYDHPKNNEVLMFQRDYLSELMKAAGREKDADTVGTFSILAKSPDDVRRIARAVDAMFDNSPYPTRTETEREFGLSFMAFLGNIKMYLAVICSAVTFTILLVSANSIAMSVRERTRETGILRTLGYTPGEIMAMVLGESVVIALIGGLLGVGATAALTRAAAAGMGPWGEALKMHWAAAAVVAALAVVIGVASAFVPAVFASRRNIVEAIRFTG
jgi:putative ABC transport system permease protein